MKGVTLLSLTLYKKAASYGCLSIMPPRRTSLPSTAGSPRSALKFLFSYCKNVEGPFSCRAMRTNTSRCILPPL